MEDIAVAKDKAHEHSVVANTLLPVFRGLGTVFVVGLGTMLGAVLAALAFPSPPFVGALGGGCLGAAVFTIIGCCVTGFYQDIRSPIPDSAMGKYVPHAFYAAVGSHGEFTLVVTIHRTEDVSVKSRIWNRPQLYVEMSCGDNPVKTTCVNAEGQFDEQFKIRIKTTDDHMLFMVKDQQFFSADSVGFCAFDLQADIINKQFPKNHGFQLEGGDDYTVRKGDGKKPKLVLSFDAIDIGSQSARHDVESAVPLKYAEKGYGAVSFLPALQFNQQNRVEYL
eukprot:TRINITY_DN121469_c0_g1_i1.p1 TRINITY_DN121469_c0_g1~~TRINITY_DN121469_c0_g1_i1.p1  ORF type:complete len:319 (-),score=31.55 TRINITY_DN121469_c0_g1_i1:159-995(-)